MSTLLIAAVSAFGVVFVAELGDKTQLLALGYGSRFRLRTVAVGLTIGYAAAGAIASVVGGVLGAALPDRPIGLAAGALFLVFAWTTWADRNDNGDAGDAGDERPDQFGRRRVIASIALAIAIAELGDKTQLATVALAARSNPAATWIGATAGEVSAGMLGAFAGQRIGRRVDPNQLRLASAATFAVFGVVIVATAF